MTGVYTIYQYILPYIEAKLCCLLVTYCIGLIQVLILIKCKYLARVMSVFFSIMSAVVIGTFMRTISSVIIASAPGLPLASVPRSLGSLLQLLEGS